MTWLVGITDLMDVSLSKASGDDGGQGSLACCSPWGGKESDTTERLNNSNRCYWGILSQQQSERMRKRPDSGLCSGSLGVLARGPFSGATSSAGGGPQVLCPRLCCRLLLPPRPPKVRFREDLWRGFPCRRPVWEEGAWKLEIRAAGALGCVRLCP